MRKIKVYISSITTKTHITVNHTNQNIHLYRRCSSQLFKVCFLTKLRLYITQCIFL